MSRSATPTQDICAVRHARISSPFVRMHVLLTKTSIVHRNLTCTKSHILHTPAKHFGLICPVKNSATMLVCICNTFNSMQAAYTYRKSSFISSFNPDQDFFQKPFKKLSDTSTHADRSLIIESLDLLEG